MIRPLLLLLALAVPTVQAAGPLAQAGVESALATQTAAWNRGDLETFVSTYAPDCSFVGKEMTTGRDQVLVRYRTKFPTPEKMGRLAFHLLKVQDIEPGMSAYAVGEFHLKRSAAGGGNADGIFTLVFRKINSRWLILLDHTS